MLSAVVQSFTYCMIEFIWHPKKEKNYRDGCQGLGVEGGFHCKGLAQGNSLGCWNCTLCFFFLYKHKLYPADTIIIFFPKPIAQGMINMHYLHSPRPSSTLLPQPLSHEFPLNLLLKLSQLLSPSSVTFSRYLWSLYSPACFGGLQRKGEVFLCLKLKFLIYSFMYSTCLRGD